MEAITVTAIIKAKPGRAHDLRGELIKVVGLSRTEQGCLEYVLNESLEDSHTFIFYERWENAEAAQAHLDSDHYKEYRSATEKMVAAREVYRMQPITAP
ncbi:putative quinol monooxygenase [Saccharibacillus endophyticus]|uniref:Antibiotic biosynthesis monooxygenase n=1 Tax=Saccharibacillus endophyticus TaxID=2060666 RepID=A0ABQ2A727_9BACL|nr:putative quinol monooxygenase [Saccharibacillus endophyticus]GGH86098.1 antibiotic biosynthesis monooxygenase [Saccharibacillus endophyticus]